MARLCNYYGTVMLLCACLYVGMGVELLWVPPSCPLGPPCSCQLDNVLVEQTEQSNTVNCAGHNLTKLTKITSNGNTKYEVVDLSHNQLDDLPQSFTKLLMDVVSLYLHHNVLTEMPETLFSQPRLRQLDISHNLIQRLVLPVDTHLPSLEILDLSHNRLHKFTAARGINLHSLQSLILSHNFLQVDNDFMFVPVLSKLTRLDLTNNYLKNIPADVFVDIHPLVVLILRDNKLTTLAAGVFKGLVHLQQLDLHGNKLQHVDSNAFQNLSSLQRMFLGANQFTEISEFLFTPLKSVKVLDLSDNRLLSVLSSSIFKSIRTTLIHLNLRGTGIRTLQNDVFLGLNSLQSLSLANTPIRHFPNVYGLNRLYAIDLQGTNITTVYPCEAEFLSNTVISNIHLPALTCDCQIAWLRRVGDSQFTAASSPARQQWECSSPARLRGRLLQSLTVNDLTCDGDRISVWCPEQHLSRFFKLSQLDVKIQQNTATVSWIIENSTLAGGMQTVCCLRLTYNKYDRFNSTNMKTSNNMIYLHRESQSFTIRFLKYHSRYKLCLEIILSTNTSLNSVCKTFQTPVSLMVILGPVLGGIVIIFIIIATLMKVCRRKPAAEAHVDVPVPCSNTTCPTDDLTMSDLQPLHLNMHFEHTHETNMDIGE